MMTRAATDPACLPVPQVELSLPLINYALLLQLHMQSSRLLQDGTTLQNKTLCAQVRTTCISTSLARWLCLHRADSLE